METKPIEEVFVTRSSEETQNIGKKLGEKLSGHTIITLHGELGAGKTTFVQGVAKGLGITKRIISPTFVIIRTYELTNRGQLKNFYHIDLYRLENKHAIEGLGVEEQMSEKDNILVIEWAERLGDLLAKKRIDITFTYVDENTREIKMEYIGGV